MLIGTDLIECEIRYLRSRICGLEQCVFELLLKNERLRSALSSDASMKWANRPDAAIFGVTLFDKQEKQGDPSNGRDCSL